MLQITDFEKIESLNSRRRKFGETYLVRHKKTGEKGVLKIVDKTAVSPELSEQLRIESQLSFSVPGLPEILCVFENEHYSSFVKKYREGLLWNDYLDQLSDADFYRHVPKAVSQLIGLLHSVHEKGYIHGDLKPSNILIDAVSPDDFQLHLLDFGLSFQFGYKTLFKLPFSIGFSAPELMLGYTELADETTDFYALGITLFNIFTGTIPLAHPNPEAFINLQLTHPLPKHSKIPRSVFSIIEKMTAKPVFPLPPNQLSDIEKIKLLQEGKQQRLPYEELSEAWNSIEIRKKWFRYV